MAPTIKDVEKRIDELVAQARSAMSRVRGGGGSNFRALEAEDWAALRAAGLAFIEATFGRDHSYYQEFDKQAADSWESSGKHAFGILSAIQRDIKNGWIETTKGLVTAEVFADFLEMAQYLLEQNYKDAAAVMVGGVLEEHLRQLCMAASVPVEDRSSGSVRPRKAESLNADLVKASKYTVSEQKQVTAWLDLRNKAAHGKYSDYVKQQVSLMLDGVRDFIFRIRP
jgi:hypothetical protein